MLKMMLGLLALILGIALTSSASAQTYTWVVPNGSWANASNWSPITGPPGAGDNAVINFSANATVSIDTPVSCNSLTIGGGSFLQTVTVVTSSSLAIGAGGCTVNSLGTLNVNLGGIASGNTISIASSGTMTIDSGTLSNTTLTNNGSLTITGTGTSTFNSVIINNAGMTTWNATADLLLNNPSAFNNQAAGSFFAGSDHNIDSQAGAGATFNNAGFFDKSNSAVGVTTTITSNVTFSNTGTVAIPFNNTVAINNFPAVAAGTLGGNYQLSGNLTINTGATISTLTGNILLQGANAKIMNGGGMPLLANATSSSGILSLSGGAALSVTGPFSTSGSFGVDTGASFTVTSGNFTIASSGTASLDGAMLNVPAGIITNNGFFFGGNSATVTGSLTNAGTLSVNTDQILHISGNFTQTSAGNYDPSITSPTDFGVLDVSGTATLDGTLFIVPSYTPATGDTWKLLTYTSHSGQFATVNSFSSGFSVAQIVNPGDITAQVGAFVGNPPIIFFIDVSATAAESNTPITFNAIAADINGLPLNYHWDFGDGSTGSGSPITHAFPSDASWTVTVHVDNGAASSTATVLVTTLSPNSGGAGIPNVGDGQSAPNPLNGFTITLVKSDGGLCQFNLDINALIRANFSVSTAFDTIDGRNSTVVGLQPVFKADQSGVYVATSSATDSTTNVLAGRARKTIGMSGAEVGATPQVKTPPKNHGIGKASTKGKFQFPKSTAASIATPDTVTFSGTIELPEGLDLSPTATREFQFSVGNIIDSITINSKGKSVGASKLGRLKKVSISFPHLPKGTTSTPASIITKFQVMVSQAGLSLNGFDTEGITNTYAASEKGMKSVKRSVQVAMVFAGVVWQTSAPVTFTLSPKADSGAISGRSSL
jgi:hypothetical protein